MKKTGKQNIRWNTLKILAVGWSGAFMVAGI